MVADGHAFDTSADLAAVYETAPVGLACVDRSLRYVRINARLAAIHDVPAADHLGRSIREVLGDARADVVEPLYRRVIETNQPVVNREARGRNPQPPHEDRVWLSNYYPLVIDGDVVGVNIVVQDITDLRRGEERQLSFDALLQNMTEGFALCEAIFDTKGHLADYTILEMNPALQRMLGVGPEAVGTKLSDSEGDRSDWLRLCDRVLKTGEAASFEIHTRTVDLWHEIRVTRVTQTRMAQLFFDITERKKAEARQAELFDELNHRVNNNLALVAGILRMKARDAGSDVVRDHLLRAEARVHSIAQVHRALYRGARKDAVDFGAYLQDLCAGLKDALVYDDERIEVRVEVEAVPLSVDTAIPMGMAVNELVTNAVKYAYPPPDKGLIMVRFARVGNGLVLSVRDFGRGLPGNAESRPGGGLGMKLVKSLVAQVNGDLSMTGPPGAAFEIRVPVP
jgi:two-component system CheB/CheR fusion protein